MTEPHPGPPMVARKEGHRALRICLAASGGGHVRQLLDLEPVWSSRDHFFVTEDTALGQTLRSRSRTYFVPHFAWGQAKLGAPFRMAWRAIVSLVLSARVIARERPDLLVTTGAGAVIFVVFWARLFGARIVAVESFARFDKPSLFARIVAPLANDFVIQSKALSTRFPSAHVFDPLRILEGQAPAKAPLLFATVGATLPFDRLVESVSNLKARGDISERVIVQTGVGGLRPDGLEVHESLPFDAVQSLLRDASVVVCHGGTGSLITALRQGCHVIAMPRLFRLGEHYDDHQAEITEAFARRGLIQVANSEEELRAALAATSTRTRKLATTDPTELLSFLEQRCRALEQRSMELS